MAATLQIILSKYRFLIKVRNYLFRPDAQTGYTHKIQVDVNGRWIMFEPDEERNYRHLVEVVQLEKGAKVELPYFGPWSKCLSVVK